MGLAAFRLRERRLAEQAKAPPRLPQPTLEERLEAAHAENHHLRALLREQASGAGEQIQLQPQAANTELQAEIVSLRAQLAQTQQELQTCNAYAKNLEEANIRLRKAAEQQKQKRRR
jgi:hypothetical protein